MQILSLIWINEKTGSYSGHGGHGINPLMHEQLTLIIKAQIPFEENDFQEIYKSFRGGYWFGCSGNGKHEGEWLYRHCCIYNTTAAISYEKFFKREPFILNNKRVYERSTFIYENRYCTVTGWNEENNVLTVVSYELGSDKGKKKLLKFDRKQWLEERKSFKI